MRITYRFEVSRRSARGLALSSDAEVAAACESSDPRYRRIPERRPSKRVGVFSFPLSGAHKKKSLLHLHKFGFFFKALSPLSPLVLCPCR